MINYRLTEEQLEQIQWGMHHSRQAEVRQRATAIHLLHQGYSPSEVSSQLAVSLGSIYNWHKRWRSHGVKGLANEAKRGRPKNTNAAYCELLEKTLDQSPSEYGYGFGIWTVDRLREHLRRVTGIRLSNRRFRVLLKELGFVYRRPKHDLTSLQDAEAKQRGKQLLDWLKKDVRHGDSFSSLWMKQL
jgi:transposase